MSNVDRDALIDAAADYVCHCDPVTEPHELGECPHAIAAVDAVLPLIADAIDAKRAETASWFRSMPGWSRITTARANGSDDAYRHCADLVRALSQDGGNPDA